MPNTIIDPNAMVIHSQNTSFANTAMMCTGRLIVRTLLTISQISTLALDFVNWVFGVFDIGCVGGGDPTRIREDRDGVGENAHEGDEGENDGVEDARRGHEAEPAFYEDEDCGQVYVQDGQNDDGYRYREAGAILHCFWWREIQVSEPTGVKTTASPGAEIWFCF